MQNERTKRLKTFYEQEFPWFVKCYYEEFHALYTQRYKSLGVVESDDKKVSLFEYIENFIRVNYDVPYEIQKDLTCHNSSIFYRSTNDFGFGFKTYNGELPREIKELFQFRYDGEFPIGLFSHSFLGRTGLSKIVNDKVKKSIDVEIELIKLRLRSYLKRFFMHGGVDWKWIVLDQIYHYGIDKFPNCLDHKFSHLEYSIGFFERLDHLPEMDGKPYGEHESYAKEIKFYSELKTKRVNDYTYLDVLEKELLYKFISKKNKIYAHCQSLGDIPILKLNKRPSLLGEAGPYTERYLNYLKYSFNSSYDELCPYHFVLDFRIDVSELITDEIIVHKYLETYNEPENGIRALFGLPKIGEGWISETNLFYEIKSQFSDVVVFQHARPEWLEKQHLDIYLPKYNIGIEFQGDQHFYPVEYFGGEASFIKNQERDKKKRMLCEENSCVLMYVKPGYSKSEVLLEIGNRISVQKAKVNRPSSNQSV